MSTLIAALLAPLGWRRTAPTPRHKSDTGVCAPAPEPISSDTGVDRPAPESIPAKIGVCQSGPESIRLSEPPVATHVATLLAWLGEVERHPSGVLLARTIESVYAEMCLLEQWHPRPWPPIAKALRERTGLVKRYAWIDTAAGKRRLCVYDLDGVLPAACRKVPVARRVQARPEGLRRPKAQQGSLAA